MTLKSKLLLAFLFVGIIPSMFLGSLILYKSNETMEILEYQNLYEHILSLDANIKRMDEYVYNNEMTVFIKNGDYTGIEEKYLDYIKRINEDEDYIENKNVEMGKIDQILYGYINDEENGYEIYHFHKVIGVNSSLTDIGTIFIKSSLIIITISIGLSLGLSYTITSGITKLMNYMKKVEKGELDFKIPMEKHDEIGILTESFRKMTIRLNKLINQTLILELSEKEANLKALQAQISPHFLYNALDSINWQLIDKEDYETSEILGSLSEILRYSISSKERMVKISEEFRQLGNYLRIQKNRFEDRLDYEVIFDYSLKDYFVPKLLVQPLVENAVIYNVENSFNYTSIKVSCKMINENILITIKDNGSGIEINKLEKIQKDLKDGIKDTKGHIGLLNVNNRIKLIYGKNYYLNIDSNSKGTVVTLLIDKIDRI
jgi:sensor histidine kinase YesM